MIEMLIMLFPLFLTAVVLLGYCLAVIVGPAVAWTWAFIIVVILFTSTPPPPDDPTEDL